MAKHAVLVPGFAGFDALGTLRYYAGVTQEFRGSRFANGNTIDYFDNFPTASVAQRAERLRRFLAKKYVRGEFSPGDELTLIGHSTGGLDIRRFLRDLRVGNPDTQGPVDTSVDGCLAPVTAAELRGLIRRVVFLSVPHFGTNIADFFHKVRVSIQTGAASAAAAIRLNKALPDFLSALSADIVDSSRCELFDAIADTLRETDESSDALKRADEREARYSVLLWLEHVQRDVSALTDLRSYDPRRPRLESPAWYGPEQRQAELDEFSAPAPMENDPAKTPMPRIDVLSFATRVPAPKSGNPIVKVEHAAARFAADVLNWLGPLEQASQHVLGSDTVKALTSAPVLAAGLLRFARYPEHLFWHAHAICADRTLPFERPDGLAPGGRCGLEPDAPMFQTADVSEWDNDGIVNTLSMLWPHDPRREFRHVLVNADHGDVIGHYVGSREPKPSPGGRQHAAYDVFQSGSKFTKRDFDAVWQMAFEFAY
jgi:hypothetical protein